MMDRAASRDETIYALSSGAGRAGVAVVRVSGPDAARAVRRLAGPLPEPRRASVRMLREADGEAIDQAIVLWLPGPGSFTGEDVAEFHVHGGRAVVAGVLDALSGIEGLRPAEAGAFARRAFENGRLDLTEVEGLADLIEAETAAQRRQALRQLEGHAGAVFRGWRSELIDILALAEAGIDFADEDGVPDDLAVRIAPRVAALAAGMRAVLADGRRGEMLREGLVAVIAGPPNAGKSSLMNWLAGRDVAIVSDLPGTTRDALEVRLDLAGVPVTVVDTAGIREAVDAIEREGVRRALARAEAADLILWMHEAGTDSAAERPDGPALWTVENKIDRQGDAAGGRSGAERFRISVATGAGLAALVSALETWAGDRVGAGTDALITRARHRRELEAAAAALERAQALDYAAVPDLHAEDIRSAAAALGRIVGRVDVEDVLDAIFSGFCIGK